MSDTQKQFIEFEIEERRRARERFLAHMEILPDGVTLDGHDTARVYRVRDTQCVYIQDILEMLAYGIVILETTPVGQITLEPDVWEGFLMQVGIVPLGRARPVRWLTCGASGIQNYLYNLGFRDRGPFGGTAFERTVPDVRSNGELLPKTTTFLIDERTSRIIVCPHLHKEGTDVLIQVQETDDVIKFAIAAGTGHTAFFLQGFASRELGLEDGRCEFQDGYYKVTFKKQQEQDSNG